MATVKSPKSVQVCEAISDRCIAFQRKLNGNFDSAKYQNDVIHDIKVLCECVVFPQKGYIFIHNIAPCHNSRRTRTFQECKGIPVVDINTILNVCIIMKRLVTKCHVKRDVEASMEASIA